MSADAPHAVTTSDAGIDSSDARQPLVVDTRQAAGESCVTIATRALEGLRPGEDFILVADHDPRGLGYMFQAERPGQVAWQVLQDGPELWRVRVTAQG